MVWKKIKKPTSEEVNYFSKRAVKKKFSPMFLKGHTRKACEVNQAKNCKIVINKKLTIKQMQSYNQILDEQRVRDNVVTER